MNKSRRQALEEIKTKIKEISGDLETLRDEEQEYIDNMPENLQGSDKASAAQVATDAIGDAIDNLSEACNEIDEAMS